MPTINIAIDQLLIDRADDLARRLSERYGVPVSRAAVIRRAISAYEPHDLQDEEAEEIKASGTQASK